MQCLIVFRGVKLVKAIFELLRKLERGSLASELNKGLMMHRVTVSHVTVHNNSFHESFGSCCLLRHNTLCHLYLNSFIVNRLTSQSALKITEKDLLDILSFNLRA